MKKTIFVLVLTLAFVSCKTKEKKEEVETMVETEEEFIEVPSIKNLEVGCYTYNANGSKIVMEITQISDSVMGNLN